MLNLTRTSLILATTLTLSTAIFVPNAQAKLAFSSTNTPNPGLKSQVSGVKVSFDAFKDFSNIPELNLTEEQETQLQEVQENLGSRLSEILTDYQLESLKTAVQSGKSRREIASSLNLSFRQKRRMRSLMRWHKKQLKSILSDEQREILKEFRETRNKKQNQLSFGFKQL